MVPLNWPILESVRSSWITSRDSPLSVLPIGQFKYPLSFTYSNIQMIAYKNIHVRMIYVPYWLVTRMAPEVITENGTDYKADIWSLGITCIGITLCCINYMNIWMNTEMVRGQPPLAKLPPLQGHFHNHICPIGMYWLRYSFNQDTEKWTA